MRCLIVSAGKPPFIPLLCLNPTNWRSQNVCFGLMQDRFDGIDLPKLFSGKTESKVPETKLAVLTKSKRNQQEITLGTELCTKMSTFAREIPFPFSVCRAWLPIVLTGTCRLRRQTSTLEIWQSRSSMWVDLPLAFCKDNLRIPSPATWFEEEKSLIFHFVSCVRNKVWAVQGDTHQSPGINYDAWRGSLIWEVLDGWYESLLKWKSDYAVCIAGLGKQVSEVHNATFIMCAEKFIKKLVPARSGANVKGSLKVWHGRWQWCPTVQHCKPKPVSLFVLVLAMLLARFFTRFERSSSTDSML